MSLQTVVPSAMVVATAGMKGRIGDENIRSKANCSVQKETFTVSAADTTTTVTVNGVAYTWTAGTNTTTAIAAALVILINAGQGTKVIATSLAAVITIKSLTPGLAFTSAATASCVKAIINPNSAAIPFGVFVVVDANDENSCKPPSATAEVTNRQVVGVTAFTQTREQTDEGYALNTEVNAVSHSPGRWVICEQAMVASDQVFVRFAAGAGGSQLGAIRKDADSASAVGITNCNVLEYDSTLGLALIALNLPY